MSDQVHQPDLRENKMGVMPVGKLLFNMALPIVIAMLVQALYNVVDSIFVSEISESAVTALGLAFPLQNLLIGFAVGIGVGVNSMMSKALGEKDQKMVDRVAGNGIFLSLIATLLFVLFGIFGTEAFFRFQSESAETIQNGVDYTSIICIGSLGIFVEILGERLLQASGRTGYTLITQGTGAVLNIILDPLFIKGFEPLGIPAMGISGAAIATIIGQWVAAILAVIFNFKCNPDVHFSLGAIRPRGKVIRPILSIGIPSIIMNSIGSVMTLSMNKILQGLDPSETAAGVFGIYFKLQSFFFMPLFGINNASISILAYNYGARKPKRIIDTLKVSAGSMLTVMILGLSAFHLLPDLLLGLFHPTDAFLHMGRSALRIIALSFPLAAISISLIASFQALGSGIYSTINSICRQLLVLIPAAYLLSLSGNVNAVWWAFPIAEVVSVAVTLLLFLRIFRKKIRPL